MDFTGKLLGVSRDIETQKLIASFSVNEGNEFIEVHDQMKAYELISLSVKKYRNKRSVEANNYCWHIISQIAKHSQIRSDKDAIYEVMLQKYGTPYLDENGVAKKISVYSTVTISDFIKHAKLIGTSTLQGREFSHYIVIKGSSEYNTEEMSCFIDGVVSDAKELGIQTATFDEIEAMKQYWKPY